MKMEEQFVVPKRLWEDVNRVMVDLITWIKANPQEDRLGFTKVMLDMMFERICKYTDTGEADD